MTDQEVLDFYKGMEEHFGVLPSFEHEPIRFAYYVKMYKYYKERK